MISPGAGRELKQMTKIVTAYVRHRSAWESLEMDWPWTSIAWGTPSMGVPKNGWFWLGKSLYK